VSNISDIENTKIALCVADGLPFGQN